MHRGEIARPAPLEAGFTYIGLLVLVALIGFALAAAGEVTATVAKHERERELLFIGHQYRDAIARFYRQNHRFPDTLAELVTADTGGAQPAHYLRHLYLDPMTRAADWTLVPAPGAGIGGVASASMQVPLKQAGFDDEDIDFDKAKTYAGWVFRFDPRGALPRTQ